MERPLVNQCLALVGQVNSMLVEFHLSKTNRSYQAQTWITHMTDGDANSHAISPPQTIILAQNKACHFICKETKSPLIYISYTEYKRSTTNIFNIDKGCQEGQFFYFDRG